MSPNSQPIFIHSLFRAGSTYVFNVFRRSAAKYCCYQEPLNEWLLHAATAPEKLLEAHAELTTQLRHPDLDKPYFYEFYLLAEAVGRLFKKGFSYDQFFSVSSENNTDLIAYFAALSAGSQGQPVFQCCRSTGRVVSLKSGCPDAKHLFLWRNPWDQWWSYKLGFDTNNLLIANAADLPEFLKVIKEKLQIPEFHDPDTFKEYAFFSSHWLDASGSYMLFYALWCHAVLEALPHCNLSVSIDRLSNSDAYRAEVSTKLAQLGIHGLDFSDCSVPMGNYGKNDIAFFSEIEERVHGLLLYHGYRQHQLDTILALRQEYSDFASATVASTPAAVRDAERARSLARKYESELAGSLRQALRIENDLTASCQLTEARLLEAEAKLLETVAMALEAGSRTQEAESRTQEAEAKAQEAEVKAQEAEAKAQEAETKAQEAEAKAQEAEAKAQESEVRNKEYEMRIQNAEANVSESEHKAKERETSVLREAQSMTQNADARVQEILESLSWRITAPLRALASPFMGGHRKKCHIVNKLTRFFIDGMKLVPGVMWGAKYCERRWRGPWAKLMQAVGPLPATAVSPTFSALSVSRLASTSPIESLQQNEPLVPDNLSPRTRQIYHELKLAIEQRQKESH